MTRRDARLVAKANVDFDFYEYVHILESTCRLQFLQHFKVGVFVLYGERINTAPLSKLPTELTLDCLRGIVKVGYGRYGRWHQLSSAHC